jgi:hypothetical protein
VVVALGAISSEEENPANELAGCVFDNIHPMAPESEEGASSDIVSEAESLAIENETENLGTVSEAESSDFVKEPESDGA